MNTKEILIILTTAVGTLLLAGGAYFIYEILKTGNTSLDTAKTESEIDHNKKYTDNTNDILSWLRGSKSSKTNDSNQPIIEKTQTHLLEKDFTWSVEKKEDYESARPHIRVLLDVEGKRYVINNNEYGGCDSGYPPNSESSNISRYSCWFAGGGTEYGIFEEQGRLFVKERSLSESGGPNVRASRYGTFHTVLELNLDTAVKEISNNNYINFPWERKITDSINGVYYFPDFADIRDIEITDNHIWVAAFSGVFVFSKENYTPVRVFTQADGFHGIPTALKVVDNKIFIGTQAGLHILDIHTGSIKSVADKKIGHEKFNSNLIHFIVKNNILEMGTFGGVRKFDISTEEWLDTNAMPTEEDHSLRNEYTQKEKDVLAKLKKVFERTLVGTGQHAFNSVVHVFGDGRVLAQNTSGDIVIFDPKFLNKIENTGLKYSGKTVVVGKYIWNIKSACDGMGCSFRSGTGNITRYDITTGSKKVVKSNEIGTPINNQEWAKKDTLIMSKHVNSGGVIFYEFNIDSNSKREIAKFSDISLYTTPVYQPTTNKIIALSGSQEDQWRNIVSINVETGELERIGVISDGNKKVHISSLVTRGDDIFAIESNSGAIYLLSRQITKDGNRIYSFNKTGEYGIKKLWEKEYRTTSPYNFIKIGDKIVFKSTIITDGDYGRSVFMTNGKHRSYKTIYKYITGDNLIGTFSSGERSMFFNPDGIPIGNGSCVWWKSEYGNGGIWGGCK